MKIAVVGTGYIGLISGICLATDGHKVTCVDQRQDIVERLSRGQPTIFEEGLAETMTQMMETGTLPKFTAVLGNAITENEVIVIAVGTPVDSEGGADLTQVMSVANSIGAYMAGPCLVVVKSTVPVGTCRTIEAVIEGHLNRRGVDHLFSVVHNPEFLREGHALTDYYQGRIIIGMKQHGPDHFLVKETMEALYPFQERRIIFMGREAAEMTKYAANAMLATRISFMNSLSGYAEDMGVDIDEVRLGIGSDPRIGHDFLKAGLGYGGACFPKDVSALIKHAEYYGHELHLLRAVEQTNNEQRKSFPMRLIEVMGKSFAEMKGLRICVLGLSFKNGTDDVRDSPAIETVRFLLEQGCRVRAYDEHALDNARFVLGKHPLLTLHDNREDAYKGCEVVLLCTESAKNAGFVRQQHIIGTSKPSILDGRNLFDLTDAEELGMNYYSIGRPPVITARFK